MQPEACNLKTTVSIHNPHVYAVVKLIENDIRKDYKLKNVSKLICISPSYLSRIFHDETGMTLTKYVNMKKILYGKHLLETTDTKIYQVAYDCGIEDYNYFCRLFKKHIGVSPSQYRKLISPK